MIPLLNAAIEIGHPAAVMVQFASPFGGSSCSGSLIAPGLVLTAAHCVGDGSATVFVGATGDTAERFEVDRVVVHPDYVPLGQGTADDPDRNDLAVLHLRRQPDVAPVWAQSAPFVPVGRPVDAEVLVVGSGIDESGASGTKRSAWFEISDLELWKFVVRDYAVEGVRICPGDSGGPMYHLDEGDRWVQWGVVEARRGPAAGECGRAATFTRVDKAADFLMDELYAAHGERDPCVFYDRYGDGVCDAYCGRVDPDCPLPGAVGSAGCGGSKGALLLPVWALWPWGWRSRGRSRGGNRPVRM